MRLGLTGCAVLGFLIGMALAAVEHSKPFIIAVPPAKEVSGHVIEQKELDNAEEEYQNATCQQRFECAVKRTEME